MNMKLYLTKALIGLTIGASAQVTIPNAGFESWSSATGTNTLMPNGWKSSGSFPGIHRSTNAHTASYALKFGVAQYFTGVGGADMSYNFSFPQVSGPPAAYTLWAKVHLNGSDKVHVTADLMKSPSSLLIGEIPFSFDALTSANNNTTVWTQYTFTLQTTGQMPVDSAYLRFQAYPATDTASYVIIDDIAFSGGSTGIDEPGRDAAIESIYPNPMSQSGSLVYSLSEAAAVSLSIFDLLGNKMSTVFTQAQGKGKYRADLEVSHLANGIYQAGLMVNGKVYSQKVVVCH